MALTLCRRPLVGTAGVRPRRPHVRPSTWSERTPASSRKKIFAPTYWARARTRGNTVVVQRLIATGSRSYARRNGFCGVMSNSASRRPTAVTPNRTPNFCAISPATISPVHRPKAKPDWRGAFPLIQRRAVSFRAGPLAGDRGRLPDPPRLPVPLAASMPGEAPEPVPLSRFFANRESTWGYKVSPDGQRLGWIASHARRATIFFRPVGDGQVGII